MNIHFYQAHHTIQNGEYFIKNKSTGLALDANTGAYQQHSLAHPRVFMYGHNPSAPNHKWFLEKQSNGAFLLKTHYHGGQAMALDGNVSVPQSGVHPSPFLYTATPHAPNHQWWLKPTGDGISYLIVNAANGLALDGNTSGNHQHSFQHASPFLYAETPHAPNHHWIIEKVPVPVIGSLIGGLIGVSTQWVNQQQSSYPTHHHQPYQPHQPVIVSSGGVAMDEGSFNSLLNSIKGGSFESDRDSIISSASAYNYFTCNQLARILKVLGFSDEREKACRLIIPKIVDKHNSHVVLSSVTFSSEKEVISSMFR